MPELDHSAHFEPGELAAQCLKAEMLSFVFCSPIGSGVLGSFNFQCDLGAILSGEGYES